MYGVITQRRHGANSTVVAIARTNTNIYFAITDKPNDHHTIAFTPTNETTEVDGRRFPMGVKASHAQSPVPTALAPMVPCTISALTAAKPGNTARDKGHAELRDPDLSSLRPHAFRVWAVDTTPRRRYPHGGRPAPSLYPH